MLFRMSLLITLLLLPIFTYVLYKWSTKGYETFKERGIPHRKPWPLVGNAGEFLTNQSSLHKIMIHLYRDIKQHKIYGFYNFRVPFYIVNDPKLIRKMCVKDFEVFSNHQHFFNVQDEHLLGHMLSVMRNQRWKDMRNTLTPIFTGAKMRAMFTLMIECFQESMKYLHEQLRDGNSFDIELKECFSRLSNDLIATTAFGLNVNSFTNKENEFFTIGKEISNTKGKQAFKFILFSMAPKLFKLLGLKLFDQKKTDYFLRLVVETMKYREEHRIERPDMIQLLMEAKEESIHQWTEEEIVAQCFIFFFAAFENNANLLCLTCHELAENPEVQNKVYDEVMKTYENLNGRTLDYDTLQTMKYMDMVLSETLRKWSLAALLDRDVNREYKVVDDDGNFICELKPKDCVWFQVIGIHWDPEIYENPEVFDPERFNEQNKHKITPYTYMPFGVGPRICIGSRYALMQAKAMLYYVLKDFKLERNEKTTKNLLDDIRGFSIAPKNGFWIKFVKRENA